jgi:hypothetical protein
MLPIVPELAAKIELIIYNSNITKNIFSSLGPIFGGEIVIFRLWSLVNSPAGRGTGVQQRGAG